MIVAAALTASCGSERPVAPATSSAPSTNASAGSPSAAATAPSIGAWERVVAPSSSEGFLAATAVGTTTFVGGLSTYGCCETEGELWAVGADGQLQPQPLGSGWSAKDSVVTALAAHEHYLIVGGSAKNRAAAWRRGGDGTWSALPLASAMEGSEVSGMATAGGRLHVVARTRSGPTLEVITCDVASLSCATPAPLSGTGKFIYAAATPRAAVVVAADTGGAPHIWSATETGSWAWAASPAPSSDDILGLAATRDEIVAIGELGAERRLLRTGDGREWVTSPTDFPFDGPSFLVGVGGSGLAAATETSSGIAVATSGDGIRWADAPAPGPPTDARRAEPLSLSAAAGKLLVVGTSFGDSRLASLWEAPIRP